MPSSVLLVHDDISAIAAARRVLVSEGLDVSLATSCADAFTSYQQKPIQLVVLAPSVESGRGATVYDDIRSLPSGARVRFILLGTEIAEANGALVVDLPLDAEAFRAAVREALAGTGDPTQRPRRVHTDPEREQITVEAPPWGASAESRPLAEQLFGRDSTPVPTEAELEPEAPTPSLVMPAVSVDEPARPTPSPYEDVTPDGPTLERELRWDDLNLPSESSFPETGSAPLTGADVRPATVPSPRVERPSEERVLAEVIAAAEIADRARAVTAPSRPVEKERARGEALLAGEREARFEVEARLRANSERKLELEQAHADHAVELAGALARLQDERDARLAIEARLAELEKTGDDRRAEDQRESEQRRDADQQAIADLQRRLEVEESTRRASDDRADTLATEGARRAEAEARAHSATEHLSDLEQRAARVQQELEAEHAERERAQQERSHEAEARAETEARIRTVQTALDETRATLAALEHRFTDSESHRTDLEAQHIALEHQLADSEQQRVDLEDRVAETEQQRAELQTRMETVEHQLADAEQQRIAVEDQLADAEERAQAREEREQHAQAEADIEAERVAEVEGTQRDVEATIRLRAEARTSAEQRAQELATRRAELERALHESEARAQTESEQVTALEAREQQALLELKTLAQDRMGAEGRAQEALSRRAELEQAVAAAEARTATEQARLAQLEHERTENEGQLQTHEAAHARAEARARELAERSAEVLEAATAARERAEAERTEVTKLVAAHSETQQQLEAEQRGRAEAEEQVRILHAQLEKVQHEASDTSSRAQAAAAQRAELERTCAELESTLATVEHEKQAEEERAAELEKRAQVEADRRATLEQARDEAQVRLVTLHEDRALAEETNQRAATELQELANAAHEAQAQVQEAAAALEQLQQSHAEVSRHREVAERAREVAEQHAVELAQRHSELQGAIAEATQHAEAESARAAELEQARQTAEQQAIEEEQQRAAAVERAQVDEAQVAQLQLAQAEAEQKLQGVRAARQAAEAHAAELAERRSSFAATVARLDRELGTSSPVAPAPPVDAAEPPLPVAPSIPEPVAHDEVESEPKPEPVRALPRLPTPPSAPRVAPAPRRVLRPLSGGRWKRAELGPAVPLPAELASVAVGASGEGPAEARPPRFALVGKLSDLGAAAFFARCWHERVTGRFDFDCRDGARALFFEEGRLAAALSNAPSDRLETLAHREGLITRAHQRALRPEADRLSARQLAVHLVELRLIKGTELYALVRRQMEEVAYALFADDSVEYLYSPDLAPSDLRVALPMTPLAFMVEGVRRKGDFDRLNPALGGPIARVRMREGAPDASELGLSARERRLLSLIDGLRTIEELIFASGMDPQAAVKLLFALEAAGAVEVTPGEPVAAQEGSRNELLIDLGRVGEKYQQVQNGDYFEILGVTPEATSYEVRAAFERIVREFHPGRFMSVSDEGLSSRLEEIGRMVAEAADVLSDDLTRREYARNLTGG